MKSYVFVFILHFSTREAQNAPCSRGRTASSSSASVNWIISYLIFVTPTSQLLDHDTIRRSEPVEIDSIVFVCIFDDAFCDMVRALRNL